MLTEIIGGLRRSKLDPGATLNIESHLNAAIEWIQMAVQQSSEGGISKGYDLVRQIWSPPYPETTGYTIPTLLNVSEVCNRPELETLAFELADYELKCATPEGGVAHWAATNPYPIVFDTGQVMFGWVAAFEASGDERYLQAAARAGDWLAKIQHESGVWQQHQHLGVEKVIDTRVDWALLLLHRHSGNAAHRDAAVRNLKWAQQQQDNNGWFRKCAFTPDQDPFTHTLAYTAEGFFECGQLLDDQSFINTSRKTADALRERQYPDGRLASTYDSGWRETSRSSCLTGNCQMGRLWLRFFELDGDSRDLSAAQKAIGYVATTQNIDTDNRNIKGAIAGSFPIYGKYERMKYPNWATKFFIDALLTLQQTSQKTNTVRYLG